MQNNSNRRSTEGAGKKVKDSVFVVTKERGCPVYHVGDNLRVENECLYLPVAKPACLKLVHSLADAAVGDFAVKQITPRGVSVKKQYECGGCEEGKISYEFVREREFVTRQMRGLAADIHRERVGYINRFFPVLRKMEIFSSLSDNELKDVSSLMRIEKYKRGRVIEKKGRVTSHLYIVLAGGVDFLIDGKVISRADVGEFFGEICMLAGEPLACDVCARENSVLALVSKKDINYLQNRFPLLQVFMYRIMARSLKDNSRWSDESRPSFSGSLDEVKVDEVFQLISFNKKTGVVHFKFNDGKGFVVFNKGEVVYAIYNNMIGRKAFFALMFKKKGKFKYTAGMPAKYKQLKPLGDFMALLMEGMKRIDELNYLKK